MHELINNQRFTVCVRSLIYNHEKYISDCLRGFLMQETTFPVVYLLEDDASTDNTQEILRDFVLKNFNTDDKSVARVIEFEGATTIFAQHRTNPNIYVAYVQMKYNHYGKYSRDAYNKEWLNSASYIALCEGDDYWTDSHKLQKQVNFLETHSKYSFVFHPVDVLVENSTDGLLCAQLKEGDVSAEEIYERWIVPTCSVVYRKSMLHLKRPGSCPYGDIVLFLSLLDKGPAYCMLFNGGVYRRHIGGVSMHISYDLARGLFYQYKEMENLFPHVRQISIRKKNGYLGYLLYDATKIDTWKYRFYYMWLHKKLFFSAFFTTTIITYMIKPYFRYLCNR